MKEGISQGDNFLCIKHCKYDNGIRPIFIEGKIYHSFYDGKIDDENGNRLHSFTEKFWTQYLIKIGNYENSIAQKLNAKRILGKYGYIYDLKRNKIKKKNI
jgi:hypothetical protein